MGTNTILDTVSKPVYPYQGGTGRVNFFPYGIIATGATPSSSFINVGGGDRGQILTDNGSGTNPTWQDAAGFTHTLMNINVQTFTTPGAFTYTPSSPQIVYAVVELQGGGGGSGGTLGWCVSGAGAAGAYICFLVTSINNLNNITGVIGDGGIAGSAGNAGGNGGDTTVNVNGGTTWQALGGGGGDGQFNFVSSNPVISGNPGAPAGVVIGTNALLQISLQGTGGAFGYYNAFSSLALGGAGGSSFYGPGGPAVTAKSISVTGNPGYGYGGGASSSAGADGTNETGAAGAPGIVVITEYFTF